MGIEGVIRPPPEIRAVADKTAKYVSKNGRAFEARILGSGKGKTPKFAFLQPTSPFHAYYEEKIRYYENGGEDEKKDDKKKEGEDKKEAAKKTDGDGEGKSKASDKEASSDSKDQDKKETADKKKKKEQGQKSSAVIDPVAKALLTQRLKITQARSEFEKSEGAVAQVQPAAQDGTTEEPRKQQYTPPAPPPMELVHIVAPSSLTLAQVETIQLVAQFTALDGKGGPFIGKLQHREWANPAFAFCQPRHGHFAYFSALVDAYRRVYDTWTSSKPGDMVEEVASNVDKCLELTAYRVEYERDLEEQTRKQKLKDGEGADMAQIDWHDFVVVETIDFPKDEKVELAMLPPPPPPPKTSSTAAAAAAGGDAMDESDDEDGEQIRVVPSYQPKVVSQETNSLKEVIDPITGKSVPVEDMPEHMRIQLLDPKWAEERKKFQEKQKDSNLVSGDVVASNISRFSREAYGKSGHDLLGETDAKKRLEEANRIIHEQGKRGVGPLLPPPVQPAAGMPPPPPPPPLPAMHAAPPAVGEPAAKRQRLEGDSMVPGAAGLPATPGAQPEASSVPQPPPPDTTDPMMSLGAAPPIEPAKDELLPAEEFAKTLSKPEVTIQVRIPNDPAQMAWNFYGQIVSVSVDVMSKIKAVKQEIARSHLNSMPANKIQLKSSTGFLKDNATLASLNIGPTGTLDLIPKTRGGRR